MLPISQSPNQLLSSLWNIIMPNTSKSKSSKSSAEFAEPLQKYLDHIFNDYKRFSDRSNDSTVKLLPADQGPYYMELKERMVKEFKEELRFTEGSKYIKVISGSSVHSFIVKEDSTKFSKGDILKPACWNTPALNQPRGNILTGDLSKIYWTGPEYLR
jgi:hypothetical protein